MKVLRKRPGEAVEEIEIENTLKALQEEVGGYIETVTLAADCTVICDEEGRLKNKPHNCEICGVKFVGAILVVGVDGEEFCDVPVEVRVFFGIKEKAPTEVTASDVDAHSNKQVQDTSFGVSCQEHDI